jgi:hypothetical protein
MDAIDRLIAIEEIKALKARYFRCMDTKDWEAFANLFSADASIDMSGEMRASNADAGIIRGRNEIVTFVRNAINDVTTVHHGHTPEIDIVSPTCATGIWAIEDSLRWPEGTPIQTLHGYGHYHDTYEKHDESWLIASTQLTRLRLDVQMPG